MSSISRSSSNENFGYIQDNLDKIAKTYSRNSGDSAIGNLSPKMQRPVPAKERIHRLSGRLLKDIQGLTKRFEEANTPEQFSKCLQELTSLKVAHAMIQGAPKEWGLIMQPKRLEKAIEDATDVKNKKIHESKARDRQYEVLDLIEQAREQILQNVNGTKEATYEDVSDKIRRLHALLPDIPKIIPNDKEIRALFTERLKDIKQLTSDWKKISASPGKKARVAAKPTFYEEMPEFVPSATRQVPQNPYDKMPPLPARKRSNSKEEVTRGPGRLVKDEKPADKSAPYAMIPGRPVRKGSSGKEEVDPLSTAPGRLEDPRMKRKAMIIDPDKLKHIK